MGDAPITCPKCGLEQPGRTECAGCGLIFAKYNPNAQKASQAPHRASSAELMGRPYRQPIGPASRLARVGIAVGTAGIGALLVLNGLLGHGFSGYVALVLLAAVVAYFALSSFLEVISLNRYYTEALLFILVLTGVRIGYDEHFRLDEAAPATGAMTADVKADWLATVDAMAQQARRLLDRRDFVGLERCCLEHGPQLDHRLARLSAPERLRARPVTDVLARLSAAVMSDAPWNDARARAFSALLGELEAAARDFRAGL